MRYQGGGFNHPFITRHGEFLPTHRKRLGASQRRHSAQKSEARRNRGGQNMRNLLTQLLITSQEVLSVFASSAELPELKAFRQPMKVWNVLGFAPT